MQLQDVSIRRAGEGDLAAIEAMQTLSLRHLGGSTYSPAEIELFLEEVGTLDPEVVAQGNLFVAESATGVIGSAGWSSARPHYARHLPEAEVASDSVVIRSVFVHPAWARRGIARRLMSLVESEAAIRSGCARLELLATLCGLPLYSALGYREVRRLSLTLPAVFMAKELLEPAQAA